MSYDLRLCPDSECNANALPESRMDAEGRIYLVSADMCPDCGHPLTEANTHPTLTIGRVITARLS